jgi:hypothetical protein
MVLEKEVESAQFQNPAPIGPQSQIPLGVYDMEVSWDLGKETGKEGYMSVRAAGSRWWFKEIIGTAVLNGTNNAIGRIKITAKGKLNGEQLTLWRPNNAPPHPMVRGERRDVSYNRVCYFRAEQQWRLRDEYPKQNPLCEKQHRTYQELRQCIGCNKYVELPGYVGDWTVEWPEEDYVAHLFHKGFVVICDAGCFMHPYGGYGHFYTEDRWEEEAGGAPIRHKQ